MDEKGQWCEGCREKRRDAYRRPDAGGRVLCIKHYYEAMRKMTPTGLVRALRAPEHLREAE